MTTKTDPFTTAENPLGAVKGFWSTVTAAGLRDFNPGARASTGATQDNVSMWRLSDYTFGADHTSQIIVGVLGNGDWPGAAVRLSSAGGGQGYIAYVRKEINAISLYKLTAGTVGIAGNYLVNYGSLTLASGDTVELNVSGTTLTTNHNGTTLGTYTDNSYTTGQPGVAYEDGNVNASVITSWTGVDAVGGVNIPALVSYLNRRRRCC